jgi:hypothetical protein
MNNRQSENSVDGLDLQQSTVLVEFDGQRYVFFEDSTKRDHPMKRLEQRMILKAKQEFKRISPCAHRRTFEECFTRDEFNIYLWFNTEDESTHVVAESLP